MGMEIANEILRQLGGPRVAVMIGGKGFVGGENFLQFGFKARAKDGINSIRIELDASDTYTVRFHRIRSGAAKEVDSMSDIYCDVLKGLCERRTGLAFSF